MGQEHFEAGFRPKPKNKTERRIISHGGKNETVDMSVSADLVTGPVDTPGVDLY